MRQGSPVPLPKGMTGELMRQVAALDVTRMSCAQVTLSCRLVCDEGEPGLYIIIVAIAAVVQCTTDLHG